MFRIAVLVSGSGSNLQAIIDAVIHKELPIQIEYVIADRQCFALERANMFGIQAILFDRKSSILSHEIHNVLEGKVDMIVMAGFLSILSKSFCDAWKGKIINIHPSLLPKFGGPGMYGIKVHQEVILQKEIETGATVHYVTEEVDGGDIILQEKIAVPQNITPEELQKKVLEEVEHALIVNALRRIVRNVNHV